VGLIKRLFFGAAWFGLISLVAGMIAGGIIAGVASPPATSFSEGFEAGRTTTQAILPTYLGLIQSLSFAAAAIGTFFGWLPGTKPKDVAARKMRNQQVSRAQAGSAGTVPADKPDPLLAIQKLGELMHAGMITEQEYENKKAKLLDRV
jgi:hypothetical protein